MRTSFKYFFVLIALLLSFLFAENSYAADKVKLKDAAVCQFFPGFINKIVQCVTHLTSYKLVEGTLDDMHDAFVDVSNSMVVIYVMLFGLRMSLQQVEKLKREIVVLLLTVFCVVYFNNTVSITKFMNFFIKGQTEFVNAVTTVMSTRQAGNNQPQPADCNGYNGKPYTVWQKIDCVIGYVMGVHPLVQYTERYFDCSKAFKAADMVPVPVDLNNGDPDINMNKSVGCYDYKIFAGDKNPFANMADEPYKFMNNTGVVANKYEAGVAFSMLTIISLMLFSDDFGLIVMITGIFIIIMLVMAFGQAVFTYLTSLFMIIVLGLFAPIIIPMFLFEPTKNIFNIWVQMFFAAMLTPGIMFAYLSFMMFTLTYVIQYKVNINGEDVSLIDYHFGDKYINAHKDYKSLFQTTLSSSTNDQKNDNSFRGMIDQTLSTLTKAKEQNLNVDESKVGNETPFGKLSPETILGASGNLGVWKGMATMFPRTSGINSGEFNVPHLDFANTVEYIRDRYSITGLGEIILKLVNSGQMTAEAGYDLLKAAQNANDIESYMKIYQESPALLEDLRQELQKQMQKDYNDKLAYMQLLMVVFLTLAITFSFMGNVQAFAAALSTAAMYPASKAVNIYNGVMSKMTASYKK